METSDGSSGQVVHLIGASRFLENYGDQIMKRDMDLIRDILLYIESKPYGEVIESIEFDHDKYDKNQILGHLRLLEDNGLIDGRVNICHDSFLINIKDLSSQGHDLLDSIRSEEVWNKTKEQVEKVGGSVAIDTLKAVAAAIVTKMLLG